MSQIFAPDRWFSGSSNLTVSTKFTPDRPFCHGNENLGIFNIKLAITRLVQEICARCLYHTGVFGTDQLNVVIELWQTTALHQDFGGQTI